MIQLWAPWLGALEGVFRSSPTQIKTRHAASTALKRRGPSSLHGQRQTLSQEEPVHARLHPRLQVLLHLWRHHLLVRQVEPSPRRSVALDRALHKLRAHTPQKRRNLGRAGASGCRQMGAGEQTRALSEAWRAGKERNGAALRGTRKAVSLSYLSGDGVDKNPLSSVNGLA